MRDDAHDNIRWLLQECSGRWRGTRVRERAKERAKEGVTAEFENAAPPRSRRMKGRLVWLDRSKQMGGWRIHLPSSSDHVLPRRSVTMATTRNVLLCLLSPLCILILPIDAVDG